MQRTRPGKTFWGLARISARAKSAVEYELALRPGFSPEARLPRTARPAPQGARRGLPACRGAGKLFYGRYPTGPVASSQPSQSVCARGAFALLCAVSTVGREGVKTMTRPEHDRAARRRGEVAS
jgi:hypothetical protein